MEPSYSVIRCPHCGNPADCTDMKYSDGDGGSLCECYRCGTCGGRYSVAYYPESGDDA